jgi:hypothetical protein
LLEQRMDVAAGHRHFVCRVYKTPPGNVSNSYVGMA